MRHNKTDCLTMFGMITKEGTHMGNFNLFFICRKSKQSSETLLMQNMVEAKIEIAILLCNINFEKNLSRIIICFHAKYLFPIAHDKYIFPAQDLRLSELDVFLRAMKQALALPDQANRKYATVSSTGNFPIAENFRYLDLGVNEISGYCEWVKHKCRNQDSEYQSRRNSNSRREIGSHNIEY